jgi:hypothetical protein
MHGKCILRIDITLGREEKMIRHDFATFILCEIKGACMNSTMNIIIYPNCRPVYIIETA